MSHNNLTYEDWKATIESDPELFLALAEEIGLGDRIRAAVQGSTPAPSGRMMAIMDRITDLRTELEALHNELEALKTGANQNHSQGGPRGEITQRVTRELANLEARRTASGDRQPVAVNDPGRTNAHGRNGLALIEKMEALDKDEGPRVVALVDRESNEFSMIRVDPGDFETRILNNEPGKRVHHYQMSQFAQLFWMTPVDRFNAMDYQDWSKVAQFIRKATVAAQLGEPDITSTFADTPHLMAAHPTLSPDTARERLNLLERYPSASDTQTKLELTEILMAHRHSVAPDRSLFSLESLQSTPFAEQVEMTEPEAIHEEVEEKYDIAHGFGAELEGDESRGYETSPVDMLRYDTMLQEVSELKRLQQAVNARHGSAADVSDDPDDFMRPM